MTLDLQSCRPIIDISSPSTIILPVVGSINRNIAWDNDVFPAPVLPTIPTFKTSKICKFTDELNSRCVQKKVTFGYRCLPLLNRLGRD